VEDYGNHICRGGDGVEQARNLGHLHENRRQWEEENEEKEGMINCPDPNIARTAVATHIETSCTA